MPQYYYTAKSKESGSEITDISRADDKKELEEKLRAENLFLIEAEEIKTSRGLSLSSGVSLEDKIFFTKNLQMMLSGGLSMSRSLKTIATQVKSERLRGILLSIREDIQQGRTLSESMSSYPDVFSKMFVSIIKLSEETGQIEENLDILINQFQKEHQLKSEVKGALIYPAVIVFAMIGVGLAMLILVVPRLSDTFSAMDTELPITTRFFIWLGDFAASYWYLVPIIIIGAIFSIKMIYKTKKGREIFDSLILKIPVVSETVKKINTARIARTLNSLLSSGISLLKSLEIIAESTTNVHFENALMDSSESIQRGDKLSESMRPHINLFSFLLIQMIEVGEETGKTSDVLAETADFLEEEVFSSMKNLTSIIEPVLMIIVGTAVGFFAFSMLIPIYSLLEAL